MRTRHEPESEPNAIRRSVGSQTEQTNRSAKGNTRGVRELLREGRPNPYGVQWAEKVWDETAQKMVRQVKTLFFPTAAARDTKAQELRNARRSRMVVVSASRSELDDFRAFKAAVGGTPWQEVVAGWRAFLMHAGIAPCTITVETAAKTYLERAQRLLEREKLSKGHVRHMEHKVKLFVEQFGHLKLDQVPSREIEDWIEDFEEVESDFTFDNYLKHVRAFFGYFVEEKIIRENPAARLKRRSDGIGEVKIISVAQTAQVFYTALNDPKFKTAIGRLALEAFVGLRFSSGCRAEKSDINFEDKGILLPKKKLKTKRRHYIDGFPAQVWDWLAVTPEECWSLTPRQYMQLKSDLFVAAHVVNPGNCLRHGFATYHLHALKNAGLTAYILCHRNQDELWEHYKGNATEAQGKLYHTITPATVAQLRLGFAPATDPDAPRVGRPRAQE